MHGRENACSPVFICRQAPLWLMLSATIERMTHRSSTQVANCGNSSLTSVPDWPCFSKVYGEASRLPVEAAVWDRAIHAIRKFGILAIAFHQSECRRGPPPDFSRPD